MADYVHPEEIADALAAAIGEVAAMLRDITLGQYYPVDSPVHLLTCGLR